MVSEFEAVSVAMSDPDADLEKLTNKMTRLQVRTRGALEEGGVVVLVFGCLVWSGGAEGKKVVSSNMD